MFDIRSFSSRLKVIENERNVWILDWSRRSGRLYDDIGDEESFDYNVVDSPKNFHPVSFISNEFNGPIHKRISFPETWLWETVVVR